VLSALFFSPAAWLFFFPLIYSQNMSGEREGTVLKSEKDDPHHAPESGEKQPQPVKK